MGQINSVTGEGPNANSGVTAGLRNSFLTGERDDSPRPQGEGNSQSVRTAIDIYIENCLSSNNDQEACDGDKEEMSEKSPKEPGSQSSAGDAGDTAVLNKGAATGVEVGCFSKYLLNTMQDCSASPRLEKVKGEERDGEAKSRESPGAVEDKAKSPSPKSAGAVASAEAEAERDVSEVRTEDAPMEAKDETSSDQNEIVDVEKTSPPASPADKPKDQPSAPMKLKEAIKEDKGSLSESLGQFIGREGKAMNSQSVPLQVIIDHVLDTSLGENSDLPSHFPPVSIRSSSPLVASRVNLPTVSSAGASELLRLSSGQPGTASSGSKPSESRSDSSRDAKNSHMKVEGKGMIFLMDHIERVLESSFSNDHSPKGSDNEGDTAKVSSTSSSCPASNPPRGRSPAPAAAPVPKAATASHEGSISVQDIVDRVISQTDVSSKGPIPPPSASSAGSERRVTPSLVSTMATNSRPCSSERLHPSGGVLRPDLLHPDTRHLRGEDKGYRSAFSSGSHGHGVRHHMPPRVEEGRDGSHAFRADHPLNYKTDMHPLSGNPNGMAWLPPHMPMSLSMVPYTTGDMSKGMMSPASYFKMPGHPANRQPPPLIRGDKLLELPPHPPTKGCYCPSCSAAASASPGEGLHPAVGHGHLGIHRPTGHNLSPHPKHPSYPPHASMSPYSQPLPPHTQVALHPPAQFTSQLMPLGPEKRPSPKDLPKSVPASLAKVSPSAGHRPPYPMPGITTGVPPRPHKVQPVPALVERGEIPMQGSISRGEPVYHGQYLPYASGGAQGHGVFSMVNPGRERSTAPPGSSQPLSGGSSRAPAPSDTAWPERKPESVLDLSVKGLPAPRSSPVVERAPTSYPDEQPLDLSKKPSASPAPAAAVAVANSLPYPHPSEKYLARDSKDPPLLHQVNNHHRVSPLPIKTDPALLSSGAHCHAMLPPQLAEAGQTATSFPSTPDYRGALPRGDSMARQLHMPTHPSPSRTSPAVASYPPADTSVLVPPSREPEGSAKACNNAPPARTPAGVAERQDSGGSISSASSGGNGKRSNVSRHEPLQNIIGSHPPNDILYLRCLLCSQTYGSPYGFRKHFRNHHGFEPNSEHAEVASISAERSLRQGSDVARDSPNPSDTSSHSPCMSESMYGLGSGEDSTVKAEFTDFRQEGSNGKPRRSYNRGSEGRPRSADDSTSKDKCLECLTCGQTFQLNDFGGFKRHNRQHNQARSSGLYPCPECHLSFQDNQLLQDHMADAHPHHREAPSKTSVCKICGERLSSPQEYEQHMMEAHNRQTYSCKLCTANFSESSDFEQHMRSTHSVQSHGGGHVADVQQLPADATTTSASPDSSSDNAVARPMPNSMVQKLENSGEVESNRPSPLSQSHNSATSSPDTASKNSRDEVSTSKTPAGREDDKEGESGRQSCSSLESRTQSCESNMDTGSQPSPAGSDDHGADVYYKHKKFALHRKRADSMDCDVRGKKPEEKDAYDSSDSNSVGSCPERKKPRMDSSSSKGSSSSSGGPQGSTSGEKGATASKENTRSGDGEGGEDSQQSVVWDRVTRSQAGKIIKPPDYMT